jgi:hypothetical protein
MTMIWNLFKKSVHVKPTPDGRWAVYENMPEYESLRHDLRQFGWGVFLHNLLCVLGVPPRWLGTVEELED